MAGRGEAGCSRRSGTRAKTVKTRSSLMNVGRRVEYAIRALCYLAAQPPDRVVTRAEIETRQAVPQHFLSKILRQLVSADLLQSVPGAHGGFQLARPAGEISFRSAYEAIEGHLALTDCANRDEPPCGFGSVCTQKEVWRGAQEVLKDYLDKVSIARIRDEHGLVPRAKGTRRSAATGNRQRRQAKSSTQGSRIR